MDEEPILDHEEDIQPKPPSIWPTTLASGAVGGVLLVVFQTFMEAIGATSQILVTLLLLMIVLNSSLNFYRQRKAATKSLQSAIIICLATFFVMYLVQALYALTIGGVYFGYALGGTVYGPIMVLIAGFVVSSLTAVLSTRG